MALLQRAASGAVVGHAAGDHAGTNTLGEAASTDKIVFLVMVLVEGLLFAIPPLLVVNVSVAAWVRRKWKSVRRTVGCPGRDPHDLEHADAPLTASAGGGKPPPIVERGMGISNSFAGGLFLASGFVHLLGEANEALTHADWPLKAFPVALVLASSGYLITFFLEKVWLRGFDVHDHQGDHHHHDAGESAAGDHHRQGAADGSTAGLLTSAPATPVKKGHGGSSSASSSSSSTGAAAAPSPTSYGTTSAPSPRRKRGDTALSAGEEYVALDGEEDDDDDDDDDHDHADHGAGSGAGSSAPSSGSGDEPGHQHHHHGDHKDAAEKAQHHTDHVKAAVAPPSYARYLMLVVLAVHSFISGVAVGISGSGNVLPLVVSIYAHKWAEAIAVGVALLRFSTPVKQYWTLIAIYASSESLGTILGIILLWQVEDPLVSTIIQNCVAAVAAGTFTYVATLDLLLAEFADSTDLNYKTVAATVGFAGMVTLSVLLDEH